MSVRRMLCDWTHWETDRHLSRSLAERVPPLLAPFRAMQEPFTEHELKLHSKSYAFHHCRDVVPIAPPATLPTVAVPFRMGFVSSDYGMHTMGYLLQTLFERLAAMSDVQVYAYSTGRGDGSARMRRIRESVYLWRDVSTLSDDAAAEIIRQDELHILFDLNGWTSGHRQRLLAKQPAALQALLGVGYPGTSGSAHLRHYFCDRAVVPPHAAQRGFTEKLVYMPGSYQVNSHADVLQTDFNHDVTQVSQPTVTTVSQPTVTPVSQPTVTAMSELQQQRMMFPVVLCAFNQLYKVTPDVFAVWMQVLHSVPQAMLWLIRYPPDAELNLRSTASQHGVSQDRLLFSDRMPRKKYLSAAQQCDMMLDTWIVNAHSTASDMLWTGVPVLTLRSDTIATRVASSLIQHILSPAHSEMLITTTPAQYQTRAIALASEHAAAHESAGRVRSQLSVLKRELLERRASAVLFGSEGWAWGLRRAAMMLYELRCEGVEHHVVLRR
eukprot:TRINITY_DN8564_c0_g2_i1.p1 TRINITY_DN8564_c0_g2~~TRINITY_DN8564_c0_g2_i1.p1  ORF type:complete len:495 (-),score=83.11 TRINITY_DN8564_c0_g2_i1:1049-2533(-)